MNFKLLLKNTGIFEMFRAARLLGLMLLSVTLLAACGGGDVSEFSDDEIPSPVGDGIDDDGDVVPSDPGSDPVSDDELALLPVVSAGGRQFADPNVLITLNGEAEAQGDATIVGTLWVQIDGPSVVIPNPTQLQNALVVPDLLEETELVFQLVAQDSEGRLNASTTTVVVRPTPAFARVVGGTVDEEDREATFTVLLSAAQAEELMVDYATTDGTALADLDYLPQEGVLTFAAGETSATVTVPIYSNDPLEENEFFSLRITVLSGDNASSNSGVMLIRNNPLLEPVVQNIVFTNVGLASIEIGETFSNPILESSELGTGELVYSSSDENVATVDSDGLVTSVGVGRVTITATKAADDIYPLSVQSYPLEVISQVLLAPVLADVTDNQTYVVGTPIDVLVFANTGGGELTSCDTEVIPDGLELTPSEDLSTCEISGTPTNVQLMEPTEYFVTATNASGSDTASVTIEVLPPAPNLVEPGDQTFTLDQLISPLLIGNAGGGDLTLCSADILPAGLTVGVTEDGTTCQVSGTPTELQEPTISAISATNTSGGNTVNISFEIVPTPPLLDTFEGFVFTADTLISPIIISDNGGGNLIDCVADSLPDGLSISVTEDRDNCEISGTPTTPQSSIDHTITATNAGGSDQTIVPIVVEDEPPILASPTPQVYTVGETIPTFTLDNSGGGNITECTIDTLPNGLVFGVTSDGNSCELNGTPTEASVASYNLSIANSAGSAFASLDIRINNIVPSLTNLADQSYFIDNSDTPITPLTFANSGGGQLTGCVADSIPAGLSVDVSSDGASCEISGIPIDLQNPTTHTITATNSAGTDTATVNITTTVQLGLTFEPVKNFAFNWVDIFGVDHYNLLEDPDGVSGFSIIDVIFPEGSPELTSEPIRAFPAPAPGDVTSDVQVPLYDRVNARYLLQTCFSFDDSDCVDSNIVLVDETLDDSIGYIKASNTGIGDEFGLTLALSSDGRYMAVGAPGESSGDVGIGGDQADDTQLNAGAVYIFERIGNRWIQQQYIKASNTDGGDRFGDSLALSADGDVLVVGAPDEASDNGEGGEADNSLASAGAAYVFRRVATAWSQDAYLKANSPGEDDLFGFSVAISDDGQTIAIGASNESSGATGIDGDELDNSAAFSGAAYIFTEVEGFWTQEAYIKASNTDEGDNFGASVALSADGSTLAVGAWEEDSAVGGGADEADNSAESAGAVYIFTFESFEWTQTAYIKSDSPEEQDIFGAPISLSDDGTVLAVGALQEDGGIGGIDGDQTDNSAIDSGAVFIFESDIDRVWTQQAYIKAAVPGENNRFGFADLSGNGETLLVGAVSENGAGTGIGADEGNTDAPLAGAAYVFKRDAAGWFQSAFLKASNAEGGDRFGTVGLSSDGENIAIGAFQEDSAATGDSGGDQSDNNADASGAIYMY